MGVKTTETDYPSVIQLVLFKEEFEVNETNGKIKKKYNNRQIQAVIVSENTVLTAAHLLDDNLKGEGPLSFAVNDTTGARILQNPASHNGIFLISKLNPQIYRASDSPKIKDDQFHAKGANIAILVFPPHTFNKAVISEISIKSIDEVSPLTMLAFGRLGTQVSENWIGSVGGADETSLLKAEIPAAAAKIVDQRLYSLAVNELGQVIGPVMSKEDSGAPIFTKDKKVFSIQIDRLVKKETNVLASFSEILSKSKIRDIVRQAIDDGKAEGLDLLWEALK